MYVLNANHISKSYKTAGETMRILQNVNLQVIFERRNGCYYGTIRQWKDYSAPCADRG